nr:sulfotransferase [Micromonospora sp. DSM 115978]
MTKVLYITGWGRSGTTILDNVLASYPGVFSAGELAYLWRRGLAQGRSCGCGRPFPDCPLWQRILRRAYDQQRPDPSPVLALQSEVARVRDTWRLCRQRPPTDATRRYRDLMGRLYRAIADETGAELVIDSSKSPAGAAVLAGIDGVRGYLLHMVRDPRAVAHSWMRPKAQLDRHKPVLMDPHGPWESGTRWLAWNILAERVSREYPGRFRRLRYEDLVAQPRATVADLLSFTGVPADGGPFEGERTVRLGPNHTVSGNPSRFQTGRVELRADDAWRREQALAPRLVAGALAIPLLHRYGYRLR